MKNKEINLPDYKHKSDITYRDYKIFQDEMIKMKDVEEDSQKLIYIILKTFYSINMRTANELNASQVSLLVEKVNRAISEPVNEFKPIIKYQGKLYGFIDFEKMSYGELVDIDNTYKRNDMISLMRILYRPIVGEINKLGQYTIEKYQAINDDRFDNISFDIVESIIDFFQRSYLILKNSTQPIMVDKQ